MKKYSMARKSGPRNGEEAASGDYVPEAGDLIRVDFSPTRGTEKSGFRRGLVISPRSYNARVGRCHVCPVTSQAKGYPFEIPLPAGLSVTGVVVPDQGKPLDFRVCRLVFVEAAPLEVLVDAREMIRAFLDIA
ncbi:MAG: type II toxin-antitoxin system PemK/MazF family toxin [Methylorubrum populi]